MAEYTVQLLTILRQDWLNLNPDKTVRDVMNLDAETLISETWQQEFPVQFPVWPGSSMEEIGQAICTHFLMREICYETVPLWRVHWANRVKAVMTYWAKMGEYQINVGDIYLGGGRTEKIHSQMEEERNRDLTRNSTGSYTGSENYSTEMDKTQSSNSTMTDNRKSVTSSNKKSLFSDTPQNQLSDVEDGKYLTTATLDSGGDTITNSGGTQDTGSSTGKDTGTGSNSREESTTGKTTDAEFENRGRGEDISRTVTSTEGNRVDIATRAKMMWQNLIMGVITDLSPMFMSLYD